MRRAFGLVTLVATAITLWDCGARSPSGIKSPEIENLLLMPGDLPSDFVPGQAGMQVPPRGKWGAPLVTVSRQFDEKVNHGEGTVTVMVYDSPESARNAFNENRSKKKPEQPLRVEELKTLPGLGEENEYYAHTFDLPRPDKPEWTSLHFRRCSFLVNIDLCTFDRGGLGMERELLAIGQRTDGRLRELGRCR